MVCLLVAFPRPLCSSPERAADVCGFVSSAGERETSTSIIGLQWIPSPKEVTLLGLGIALLSANHVARITQTPVS